ncbi:MAG: type II toxin-antitoxin system YafQ family toxin [bacterium]
MKIVYSSQFKKDYKKVKKQNKDVGKLNAVIDKLAAKERLDAKYRDHPLTGSWKGFRDCHLEPDWILIYQTTEEALILARTGSHSELFKS